MLNSSWFELAEFVEPQYFPEHLNLSSTLQDLPLYDCQFNICELGEVVNQSFKSNSLLPGVILMENGEFFGMISRRRFLERLSQPYGIELFLKRPLDLLYRWEKRDILILPGSTLILEATQAALQRALELVYEPIVVQISPQIYRLIDMYELLMAQSSIHQLANQVLQQLYQELQSQASLDGLTQVANRRRFDQYFEEQWAELKLSEFSLSFIFADVDFFKAYNDTYGHLAGDDCLKQVASAIAHTIEQTQGLVARYGGEEFVVLLPKISNEQAVLTAEEIRENIKSLQLKHESSLVSSIVTLSLGVATVDFGNPNLTLRTPSDLIIAADQALYKAKSLGRDQAFYSH